MSEMSNYLENALVDHVFRNSALSSPTTVYLALFTDDPAEDASGTEVATGAYAREAVAFAAPADGVSTNSGVITFTTATANWGTITHFAIFDAVTTGNMLVYSPLDTSKAVNTDDTAEFAAGNISITFA